MYSVIYECEGVVHQIGPFNTEEEADNAAKTAQAEGEFDISDQNVYLMHPDHRMVEYSMADLGV